MVMARCKINPKYICTYSECTPRCNVLKETGQQTFGAPAPEVIETKKRKGHTTVYYKVKKGNTVKWSVLTHNSHRHENPDGL